MPFKTVFFAYKTTFNVTDPLILIFSPPFNILAGRNKLEQSNTASSASRTSIEVSVTVTHCLDSTTATWLSSSKLKTSLLIFQTYSTFAVLAHLRKPRNPTGINIKAPARSQVPSQVNQPTTSQHTDADTHKNHQRLHFNKSLQATHNSR